MGNFLKRILSKDKSKLSCCKRKKFLEGLKMIAEFEAPWKKNFDVPKREFRRLFSDSLRNIFSAASTYSLNLIPV